MTPYYEQDGITIYHADCRDVLPLSCDALVTDPPYPNNAGFFDEAVACAEEILPLSWWPEALGWNEALVFWTELRQPPVGLAPVAVHIWHRSNVNGRPYEPIYHFARVSDKRRSDVFRHAAVFDGVGPGCNEYLGHPTQKPVALMRRLIEKTRGSTVLDPFMGSGTTLRAAKDLGRKAVGIEINEAYCEIAAKRLAQGVLDFSAIKDTAPSRELGAAERGAGTPQKAG